MAPARKAFVIPEINLEELFEQLFGPDPEEEEIEEEINQPPPLNLQTIFTEAFQNINTQYLNFLNEVED
jgi:hypothetical protein